MKIIFLSICVIVFLSSLYLKAYEVRLKDNEKVKLHLYVDKKEVEFPHALLSSIEDTQSYVFLDDKVIKTLIKSGDFKSVYTRELTQNGEKILEVFAIPQDIVQSIYIESSGYFAFNEITNKLNQRKNTLFNQEFIAKDKEIILKTLHLRGYTQAKIKDVKIEKKQDRLVDIIYVIEGKEPCTISEVRILNSNLNLLNFIQSPIETGIECDLENIQSILDREKNDALKDGYLDGVYKINNISYSQNKTTARITLTIDKGKKTILRIHEVNDVNHKKTFDFIKEFPKSSYSDFAWISRADMSFYITNFYQKNGYPNVVVNFKGRKELNTKNLIIYDFDVKTGQKLTIDRIKILSEDEELSKSLLATFIKSLKINKKTPFVKSNIKIYEEAIQTMLYNKGYVSSQVKLSRVSINKTHSYVTIVFNVNLESVYQIRELKFEGLPNEDSITKPLDKLIEEKVDKPFSQGDINELQNEALTLLQEHGYKYAKIKPVFKFQPESISSKKVFVTFKVKLYQKVYINKIYVDGDIYNKKFQIIKITKLKTGQLLTPKALDFAISQIRRFYFIDNVNIDTVKPIFKEQYNNSLDIVLRIKYRSGFTFGFSPGFSFYKGYQFDTRFNLNNITKRALNFSSSLQLSQEQQQKFLSSSNRDDNINDSKLGIRVSSTLEAPLLQIGNWVSPFDVSFTAEYRENLNTTAKQNKYILGGRLGVLWLSTVWNNDTYLDLGTNLERYECTSNCLPIEINDSTVFGLSSTLGYDSTNSPAWPTRGGVYTFNLASDFFKGLNAPFVKVKADVKKYIPYSKDFSGAFILGGESLFQTKSDNSSLPPGEYRASYSDSVPLVRGFGVGSLSISPYYFESNPKNDNKDLGYNSMLSPIKSSNIVYFKYETRYKLTKTIGLVHFIDTGMSFFTNKEISNLIKRKDIVECKDGVEKCDQILNSPDISSFADVFSQYLNSSYISSGLGIEFIFGENISMFLNYGYPLWDPYGNNDCQPSNDDFTKLSPSNAPRCVKRKVPVNLFGGRIKLYGSVNFGILGHF